MKRLKQKYGEGSEEYQNAKAEYNTKIQAQKDLSEIRNRTIKGLKPGETWLYDDNNQIIGVNRKPSAKEVDQEKGRAFFNEFYPLVYKGASPFSGVGSIRKLEEVASKYNSDPNARKMFDDFLLAEKALTASTVNEAATIGAGKTNQTYKQIRESLKASDVPEKLKSLIKQYQIPASAQYKAARRFQDALNKATKIAGASIPATIPTYFNPEENLRKLESKNMDISQLSDDELRRIAEGG